MRLAVVYDSYPNTPPYGDYAVEPPPGDASAGPSRYPDEGEPKPGPVVWNPPAALATGSTVTVNVKIGPGAPDVMQNLFPDGDSGPKREGTAGVLHRMHVSLEGSPAGLLEIRPRGKAVQTVGLYTGLWSYQVKGLRPGSGKLTLIAKTWHGSPDEGKAVDLVTSWDHDIDVEDAESPPVYVGSPVAEDSASVLDEPEPAEIADESDRSAARMAGRPAEPAPVKAHRAKETRRAAVERDEPMAPDAARPATHVAAPISTHTDPEPPPGHPHPVWEGWVQYAIVALAVLALLGLAKVARQPPVILLVFANDRQGDGSGYLRDLANERRQIVDALADSVRHRRCALIVEPNLTHRNLFDLLDRYEGRIVGFHYGGHADPERLILETEAGAPAAAWGAGLARRLGALPRLRFVFLNGCSSKGLTRTFHAYTRAPILATETAVRDEVARDFAARFYKSLARGTCIRTAFERAEDELKTRLGEPATSWRSTPPVTDRMLRPAGEKPGMRWPWTLASHPDNPKGSAWALQPLVLRRA